MCVCVVFGSKKESRELFSASHSREKLGSAESMRPGLFHTVICNQPYSNDCVLKNVCVGCIVYRIVVVRSAIYMLFEDQ